MPKVTEAHSAARRQQIIDAAYRCFARKGFHQTTMREIYEEASLSPGAIYHYFPSKDAIIQASFEFDYERSLELFAAATASDDPLKALRELIFENYGELTINIDPDSIYTGALGGATFAWRAVMDDGKVAENRPN